MIDIPSAHPPPLLIPADHTITTTLSATIATEFRSLAIIAWLGSAYLIALAVVQPLSGKLTDIFGRRAGLLFSYILFAIGNAVCGLAPSKSIMILGRVAAGIGGGGLNSICTFVCSDLISLRSRGLVQGFGMLVFATGMGLGGVLGGFINDVWGWRWAFLIMVPLTVMSSIGNTAFVPGPVKTGKSIMVSLRRVDFAGTMVFVSALLLLLCSLNYEAKDGSPSGLVLLIALPLSGSLFLLFSLIEIYYASEPVVPMSLLKIRNVLCGALANLFNSMALYTMVFYVPIYWQARGLSTGDVGIRLLAEPIGAAMGSLSCGAALKITGRYGVIKVAVLGLLMLGIVGYTKVNLGTVSWIPELYLFMIGFGFAGTLTTMLLALLSDIEPAMQAIATGVSYAGRALGATIGVTVSGVLFRHIILVQTQRTDPTFLDDRGLHVKAHGCHLGKETVSGCSVKQMDAYMDALRAVFLLATGFATLGFIIGCYTRNNRLRIVS